MTEQVQKPRFGGQFGTQALTVGPRLIEPPRFGRPAAPIGAAQATCYARQRQPTVWVALTPIGLSLVTDTVSLAKEMAGVPVRAVALSMLGHVHDAMRFVTSRSAAPIGAAGRPNRGGAYETGSDGAAGGPPGARRVPTGPRRARGDAVGSRMGPYINRAPIRDSRAIRRVTTCSELRW